MTGTDTCCSRWSRTSSPVRAVRSARVVVMGITSAVLVGCGRCRGCGAAPGGTARTPAGPAGGEADGSAPPRARSRGSGAAGQPGVDLRGQAVGPAGRGERVVEAGPDVQ